jgi:uncharacterized protein
MAKTAKQPKRPKHVPLRTCIACHETKPKRELLRVVRTPDGHVVMDPTGKKSGRGAYLCARRSCWETAMKKKRLEQELETTISDEDRAALEAFIATLPPDETASEQTQPEQVQPASRTRKQAAGSRAESKKLENPVDSPKV